MASTRCAHESRHRLPPAGCASSSQDAVSRSHFLQSVKPVDWGQSQHAVPLTVASHWCSVLGQWLFLALASVLVIRKHLLIIAASFSLVLFKVQTALLCFLIMKLIDTHGENSNDADKCKVGSTQSHPPRDSTAHSFLYILRESLPFKCRMSIIISFYLKTLFLQKFSTSSTGLIPP